MRAGCMSRFTGLPDTQKGGLRTWMASLKSGWLLEAVLAPQQEQSG
jgi:hypothetical protein